jgi:hypothetical protein
MLSLPQNPVFCDPPMTTAEALEALRGELNRRYNNESSECFLLLLQPEEI